MQSLASPGNPCTFFRDRGQAGVCLCGDAHFRWVCAEFGVYAGFYGGLRGFPSALGYFTSGRVYRIRVAEGAICYSASLFSLAPEFADAKPLQRPLLLRVPGVLGPLGFGLSDDPLPPPVFRHRSSYPGFKSVLDDDIPPVEFPSSMQDCDKECTFVGQKRAASAVSLQADRSQASVVASNLKVQQVAGHALLGPPS